MLVLLILLLLSAFFSGSETAMMALNRYRLGHLAEKGHPGARRAQRLLEKPDRLIGLILLGNNLVNIIIAQLAALIGYRFYGEVGIAVATGILTFVLLIFSELAPKTLGVLYSEKLAFPAAFIFKPLLFITYPLVWLINLIANSLLRSFGLTTEANPTEALSREELRSVVNQAGNLIPRKHRKMLLSVLDLEKISVEDIMVPRNEIVGIDLDDEWSEVETELTNSTYTRMPVYHGGIDNTAGFIHMRNLLPLINKDELSLESLQGIIREPYFIPEATSLNRQLLNFQHERRRIGLVVDEYGDIQGLVTLEDLLEEIVGEFTTDSSLIKEIHPQDDGTYLVDGGTHVRDLNRALSWDLHTDGPRTLNGLVIEHMEMIPEPGTSVLIDGYPIEVVRTENNAIKTVRIKPQLETYKAAEQT